NYSYDESGQLAVTTSPTVSTESGGGTPVLAHPVTTTGYNTFGEKAESQDPNGNITSTVYDAEGNPVSVTAPGYIPPGGGAPITATTVKTYDKHGQLISESDPLNNTTHYVYDQLGDLVRTTDPRGGNTDTVYDTNGDKLSMTGPTGAQTQATYDFMGRELTSTILERYPTALASTTTKSYAASSNNPGGAFLASTTTQNGTVTKYGHDALGELNSVTDGAGNVTSYNYNFLCDRIYTGMPDGTSASTTYDASQNPLTVTQSDVGGTTLTTMSATYDGNGNKLTATDPRGNTTTFAYDAMGKLSQEVQPVTATSSISTSFGYDAAGNRTRMTDGRGNNWTYTYNSWNLAESTIEPAAANYTAQADRTFTTAYDAAGHPVSQTQPSGVTLSATYDANGQITGQAGAGADALTANRTFGYDLAGRMTSAATSAVGKQGSPGYQAATSQSFGFNDRGELLTASGTGGASSFGYNADGLPTARTDAAGTTTYGYDNAGRLSTLTDAATGTQSGYSYNAMNQVSGIQYGTAGSGDTRTYGYNGLHQLTSDTLKTAAGATVASIGYGYDLNGNLTGKTTTGFAGSAANTYTYDLANRLTSWNKGAATVNYGYDASGNRTQVGANVYTYDARDQLTSDGVNSYAYTARGTMTQQSSTSAIIQSTSDAYGQTITEASQSYTYDALARTMTDTSQNGATTTFGYSGVTNTVATDGTNTYTYDPAGGLVGMGVAAAGGGTVSGSGDLAFVDQHTDVVGDFTANGTALAGSTTYDPLGNVLATNSQPGQLGYQSGWTDRSTGKVNMAARWYNPATGQFMNRDTVSNNPVPNSAAANPFAYVSDNPMTGTDPSGHGWGWFSSAVNYVSNHYVRPVVHAAKAVVRPIVHAAQVVNRVVIQPAVHAVAKVVKTAASATAHFVEHHASAIAGFAVGAATFAGCMAITAGVGSIGCAALAGAAGNAVSYAMDCGKKAGGCTVGGAL
ncbi:MAG TPA: RHS repeat-associated core domain-containing protein, partial [Pseudonocardiaceae bacterium]